MTSDAPQREHNLREVFNATRWIVKTGAPWRYLPGDFPRWEAVYQQTQRWLKAGSFEAIVRDLRELLRVAQDRNAQPAVQEVTGEHVELAFVDQGYTGEDTAQDAREHGIELEVVKLPEAKRGFVLLPRRWSWSAVSPGHRASVVWPKTTNGCPRRASVCIL